MWITQKEGLDLLGRSLRRRIYTYVFQVFLSLLLLYRLVVGNTTDRVRSLSSIITLEGAFSSSCSCGLGLSFCWTQFGRLQYRRHPGTSPDC